MDNVSNRIVDYRITAKLAEILGGGTVDDKLTRDELNSFLNKFGGIDHPYVKLAKTMQADFDTFSQADLMHSLGTQYKVIDANDFQALAGNQIDTGETASTLSVVSHGDVDLERIGVMAYNRPGNASWDKIKNNLTQAIRTYMTEAGAWLNKGQSGEMAQEDIASYQSHLADLVTTADGKQDWDEIRFRLNQQRIGQRLMTNFSQLATAQGGGTDNGMTISYVNGVNGSAGNDIDTVANRDGVITDVSFSDLEQNKAASADANPFSISRADLLKKLDTLDIQGNKDSALQSNELLTAINGATSSTERFFYSNFQTGLDQGHALVDWNGDGRIDRDELGTSFDIADKNHDGKLDSSESQGLLSTSWTNLKLPVAALPLLGQLMDTNVDGLSADELNNGAAMMAQHGLGILANLMLSIRIMLTSSRGRLLDTDGDGRINPTELTALANRDGNAQLGFEDISMRFETFNKTVQGNSQILKTGLKADTLTLEGDGNTVDSLDGDDTVQINGKDDGHHILKVGSGNDTVRINGLTDADGTIHYAVGDTVDGGLGNDHLFLNGASSAWVDGGDGDDIIEFSGPQSGVFQIRGGAGADKISIEGSLYDFDQSLNADGTRVYHNTAQGFTLNVNADIETVEFTQPNKDVTYQSNRDDEHVATGTGKDIITLGNGTSRNVVQTDAGDDTVLIKGGFYHAIDTGIGNDEVQIDGKTDSLGQLASATGVTVNTGDGNDHVVLNFAKSSTINAGAGNDIIEVIGTLNNADRISGGDGIDTVKFAGLQSEYQRSPLSADGSRTFTRIADGHTMTLAADVENILFNNQPMV